MNALSVHFYAIRRRKKGNPHALADLHSFCRPPGKNVGILFTRFEVRVQRARTRAGVPLQNIHAAWMLLLAMRFPVKYSVHPLTPFRGALPTTDQEYHQFMG